MPIRRFCNPVTVADTFRLLQNKNAAMIWRTKSIANPLNAAMPVVAPFGSLAQPVVTIEGKQDAMQKVITSFGRIFMAVFLKVARQAVLPRQAAIRLRVVMLNSVFRTRKPAAGQSAVQAR